MPKYKHELIHKPEISVIFLCLATQIYLILENRQKTNFKRHQVTKKTYTIFIKVRYQQLTLTKLYINKEKYT